MDQISVLRQMFNSLSKEEQTEFLKSLNSEPENVKTLNP